MKTKGKEETQLQLLAEASKPAQLFCASFSVLQSTQRGEKNVTFGNTAFLMLPYHAPGKAEGQQALNLTQVFVKSTLSRSKGYSLLIVEEFIKCPQLDIRDELNKYDKTGKLNTI